MSAPQRYSALFALATLLLPSAALAQYEDHCEPFCGSYDMEFFAPTDIDLDCMPVDRHCGWFFHYDYIYWAITGDRTTIGDPNVPVLSEVIFPGNTLVAEDIADDNPGFTVDGVLPSAPDPYPIINGIQNAPPNAEFSNGDRYEMGHVDDKGRGFKIGLTIGPEVTSEQVYGFPGTGIGNGSLNGFGSVHVNFNTPPGFLLGFRDYSGSEIFLDAATDIGGDGDEDGFTVAIGETLTQIGAILGDGVVDDILLNGGTFFILDANDDGEFILGVDPFYIDFGDLHEFNIRFTQLGVRNTTELDTVELMRTHQLDNRHFMKKNQNQSFEIGYGVRFTRLRDEFLFDGNTDLFGRMFSDTQVDNQIVGPQFALKWRHQKAKWRTSLDARAMLGYNVQDIDQESGLGEGFVPGALNSPVLAQPTYSAYGTRNDTFSPVAELRAEISYQATQQISFNLGYTAMFIDGISRGSQIVEYNLPNAGISNFGKQDVFINGVNFGIEVWH